MTGWSERDLSLIGTADEIVVAPDRIDHTPGSAVPIWVVRVGNELYVRSFRGLRAAGTGAPVTKATGGSVQRGRSSASGSVQ